MRESIVKHSMNSALAWGGVLLAGALWGGGALVAQFAIERGLAPHNLALARFALGLPLLLWWHWRRAAPQHRAPASRALRRHDRALIAGVGVAMAMSVTCWFAGIAVLGAALPTVISVCCAPLVVTLISVLRGYERVTPGVLCALAMSLGGVLLIALPSAELALPAHFLGGVAWSLASAGLHALVVLGHARMPSRVPAVSAAAGSMAAAALCMTAVAAAQGLQWPRSAAVWWSVAYTGVVTTSLAYLLFAWGARRLGPTAAGVCTLVEPLVATWLAAWLLGETLSGRQWLGAVLLGGAMLLLSQQRAAPWKSPRS